jgi:NADH:ubiquinone reductase (H+-translocating)
MSRIVILGGGYAGVLAAQRLSGRLRGTAHQITLINARDTFVERTRLHQVMTGQTVRQYNLPELLNGEHSRFMQGTITALDLNQQQVTVERDGRSEQIAYDHLVYALGSQSDLERVPGVREYAYGFAAEGVRSAAALAAQLPQLAAERATVVVIGGGLTGIESVTELAEAYPGMRVTLVTQGTLGDGLSAAGAAHVRGAMDRLGVRVLEGQPVRCIEAERLLLGNGEWVAYGRVVWAGGFTVPTLAREAGFSVNAQGQIRVDEHLRSVSHPAVFAIGDSAILETHPLRMACATASPMAAHTADVMAALLQGEAPQPFRFGFVIRCISLGRRDALVQMVNADDSPREQIYTGRVAVWIKELILKGTVWILYWEKGMPGFYTWPRPTTTSTASTQQEHQTA